MRNLLRVFLFTAVAIVGVSFQAATVDAAGSGLADDAEAADAIRLPLTFERVWLKAEKGLTPLKGKQTGDLTIAEDAVEFSGRKRSLAFPMSAIRMVSFGKMKGDVNTDWVVVEIERAETRGLVGIRDGRKLGYGQATAEIHQKLVAALRQLSRGPFAVAEGFEPYVELDSTFTMAAPAGWWSYHRSLTEVDSNIRYGTVVFSAEPIAGLATVVGRKPRPEPGEGRTRASFEAGEVPSFIVTRREPAAGMTCSGFKTPARTLLKEWAGDELMFGSDVVALEPEAFEPFNLGNCQGVRIAGRTRGADGEEMSIELRAVAQGRTVVLFGLRSRADRLGEFLDPFEGSLDAFRFAVAR